MNWQGKRVLITGASQGIGQRLAIRVAAAGAETWMAARNEAGLAETVRMAGDAAGRCHAVVCDLRDRSAIENLATVVGALDVVIHNAADVTSKRFSDTSLDEIDSLIRTNVIGPLELTRLLLPEMLERSAAWIVLISSLAGYKANPSQTVYSVSKGAVNAMADALRAELKETGVHVMNVALGSVCVEGEPRPGQTTVEDLLNRLDSAMARREPELFLSPVSKWLMRLYRTFPWLTR